jgi:hypothetical protein
MHSASARLPRVSADMKRILSLGPLAGQMAERFNRKGTRTELGVLDDAT